MVQTLGLGVVAFWRLWRERQGAADENLHNALLVMRHRLIAFYRQFDQRQPHEALTKVSDLTQKMIGTHARPKIKTKGAETWGVMLFLLDEYKHFAGRLRERGVRMMAAGQSLERIVRIWNAHGRAIPAHARRACFEAYCAHLRCMAPENCYVPKHHLMIHLLHNTSHFGNPRSYANWLDESLNKTLKATCRATSQATFENSVITRMQELLRAKKRKQ